MKKFKTLNDVLSDPHFKEILNDSIEEEMHRRNNRITEARTMGYDLKSNTFIKLDSEGKMTVEYLVSEFLKVQAKQSVLCAHERRFIWLIVDEAIMKTVKYYEEHPGIIERVKQTLIL